MPPRRILIVAYPGVQTLDVCGPLEVFAGAALWVRANAASDPGYSVAVAAIGGGQVRSSSGLGLVADTDLTSVSGRVDTLIVAGGEGSRAPDLDSDLVPAIRRLAGSARRVASVCTGAFLLAEAGLLDGRRATTHWAWAAALARRYPGISVDADPIYIRDGKFWTSAGVTAGIDLTLAMVEEDLGRTTALTVARHLVLFLRRPGNQSQFSAQLSFQEPERDSLRDLQRWIGDHLAGDLRVEALAGRAAMSPRHFARAWRFEVGVTPARYVERVRLEGARRMLEDTDATVEAIAARCGFGGAETMRRSFLRSLGTPPAEYRRRFQSPAVIPA